MSGFFGGGGSTKVTGTPSPTASPAQEAYINASSPYYLNNLSNANAMGNAGTQMLLSSILGTMGPSGAHGAPGPSSYTGPPGMTNNNVPAASLPGVSAPGGNVTPQDYGGIIPVPSQSAGGGEGGSNVGTAVPGAQYDQGGYPPVLNAPPGGGSGGGSTSPAPSGGGESNLYAGWGTPASNGLVDTLPGLLQLSPEELALPGATSAVSSSVAQPLSGAYGNLAAPNATLPNVLSRLTGGIDSSGTNNAIDRLNAGPDTSTLNPIISQLASGNSGQNTQLSQILQQMTGAGNISMPSMGGSDIDAKSLLAPLTEQFNEEIMPGIQSQALAAGAIGGGGQQDLTKRAAGNYGTMAMSQYAKQKADLMNAATNQFTAGSNAALGQGQLGLQGLTSAGNLGTTMGQQQQQGLTSAGNLGTALEQMKQQGVGKAGDLATTLRGILGQETGKAGDLSIAGQDANTKAASTMGMLAPILQQLGMAGPQQAAATAGQNRAMQLQQAQVPMTLANMLIGGSSGIPMGTPPFAPLAYPGSTTSSAPSGGAQAGSAISSILPLVMMMMAA